MRKSIVLNRQCLSQEVFTFFHIRISYIVGVAVVAQWKRIQLGTMRLILGLTQWVKDPVLP